MIKNDSNPTALGSTIVQVDRNDYTLTTIEGNSSPPPAGFEYQAWVSANQSNMPGWNGLFDSVSGGYWVGTNTSKFRNGY